IMLRHNAVRTVLLASSMLSAAPLAAQTKDGAAAQPAPAAEDTSHDIIVTAQKRSENLQNVPISIQALGTKKLDELNITNFAQYA
ncbi:hypothetical protein ABTH94_21255, partial [Acinetobacter baumannii]